MRNAGGEMGVESPASEVGDGMSTLVEIAKPITLLLCILSLYAVFHTAFLIPGRTVHERLWDSLDLLVLAAGISVVSGLIFQEGEREGVRLSGTLPMQIFVWSTGIMVGLFVASWYLETYVIFYRDVRF
jgi:hypothetical protein